ARHCDEFLAGRPLPHGIEPGREERETGRAVERAGPMLLRCPEAEVLGQIIGSGPEGDNVATEGREVLARGQEDLANLLAPADPALGPADLTTQLGVKPPDHRADPVAVTPRRGGLGQADPGIVE